MVRRHHLDLDLLDSPLISPTPLTSVGGIPGSAIAEKIFNDPDSWETSSEQDMEGNDPEMAWFVDQVEMLKRLSAIIEEQKTISSLERGDLILHAFQDRQRTLHPEDDEASKLGAAQSERPTQTEPSKAKLRKKSERFSKKWEVRPPPSPLTFSPPSSTESGGEFPDIQLSAASSASIPSSKVASASATWSFLEWCGIQPGSPHAAVVESRQFRPRGLLQPPMTSLFPSQPPTSPPNLPLPPLPLQSAIPPDVKTSSMIRRLPAVPASADPSKAASASLTVPRASLPDTSLREVPYSAPRSYSGQWASLPSAMPSASSVRTPLSVRSPPPIGPRPKGFGQRGRDSSRSPHRTVAPRPPALKL